MVARLPRTVIALGFVSLFNDVASDMVIPLLPLFLAAIGGGPAALGLIEGIADAVSSFLKLWAGRLSDRLGGRRKRFALFGYGLSNLARPLIALAGSWPMVLLLRAVDRVGKGIRSAPRDALIVDSTPAALHGYAFGYHRALDHAGAVLGALIAAAILSFGVGPGEAMLWSALPGVAAVVLLAVFVREPRAVPPVAAHVAVVPPQSLAWRELAPRLRQYYAVLAIFMLARASETFLILRAMELGMSAVAALTLWAALHAAKALVATLGGRRSDRHGRRSVLLLSWGSYALSFVLFAFVDDTRTLWAVALLYGAFVGFGEGAERAQIGDLAPAQARGTAFGWYHLVAGAVAIPGGVLFGVAWQFFGASVAFLGAAAVIALATLLLAASQRQALQA